MKRILRILILGPIFLAGAAISLAMFPFVALLWWLTDDPNNPSTPLWDLEKEAGRELAIWIWTGV